MASNGWESLMPVYTPLRDYFSGSRFGPHTTAAIEMSKTRSTHWVNVHIDSLADMWAIKHGADWVDVFKEVMEKGSAEEEMLRELWFAGRLERLYRPDLGREVWRLVQKDKN